MKHLEKKLDENYTRMLHAILDKPWRRHPTKQQLYGHLFPISQIIWVRRTRHARHCWRSKDELISDIPLWTSTHGHTSVVWQAKTYIHQLCANTLYHLEDLARVTDGERVKWICADGTSWWWWWILVSFGFVCFSGISTIVGYLMPNPVFTYCIWWHIRCTNLFTKNIF